MSNARMTFRFGDQESDKLGDQEIPASSTLVTVNGNLSNKAQTLVNPEPDKNNTTVSSWTAEDMPVDWGGTILADAARSESNRLKHTDSLNYQSSDSDVDFDSRSAYTNYTSDRNAQYDPYESERIDDLDQGHNWMAESENYSYKRNRPPRGWKMIGSVSGALVTGALFGMVILSFFNKESVVKPDEMLPVNQSVSTVSGQEGGAGTAGQLEVSSAGGTYYALQYGVFSSPERAEQAKLELTQTGLAASSDPEDGNRVYAGISADREEAKLLSTRLKSQGVELYVKEIVNPAVDPAIFGNKQEDVALFFKNSSALVDQLSTLSIQQLGQSVQAAISPEMMAALQTQHQTWLTGIKSLAPGMAVDVQPVVASMEKSMNSAITAITEYNKNPDAVHMWAVQSDLMEYVLQQKKWLQSIKQ
ncbi:SPOR domain-containing protein [Paenibacillus sp. RRE4]|uniref:SPOR domain-containing protein n=1 Tax=Paenibacillus sp. RRE4 TaxID=2962587 RepID=UPI00288157C0|nr:SPOR domain-containing protein [Paenibacillus sp. RRE4]MDT0126451.1 SPOR domain-containing protein [Paenibacillus sp. RRE4]